MFTWLDLDNSPVQEGRHGPVLIAPHTRTASSQPGALPGGPEGKFPLGKVRGKHPVKGMSSNFTTGPSGHAQGH